MTIIKATVQTQNLLRVQVNTASQTHTKLKANSFQVKVKVEYFKVKVLKIL